jgi:4-carboxymuconolactone decarboxylase
MARIATIQKKEDLAPENQPVYDSIAASRGVVGGPFVALLHSPELAQRTAHLGSFIRFESSLDHKLIELTALAAARELDCKHEWMAHVNHAQKAGIPIETIRAIHGKKGPEHFSSEDAQVISYVQELLRAHRASEATFQALYGRLGEKGLVELTATVGYYAMVACTLNAFDLVTATGAEEFKIG